MFAPGLGASGARVRLASAHPLIVTTTDNGDFIGGSYRIPSPSIPLLVGGGPTPSLGYWEDPV